MKTLHFILLFILVLFSSMNIVISQSSDYEKTMFKICAPNSSCTIQFSTNKYTEIAISNLKDDLYNFQDKIISIDNSYLNNTFTIVYNEHMLLQDFITVFEANGINYAKTATRPINPKK